MLFGQEHVDRYLATDGEEGHDWQGTQCALVWNTGRKSGEERITPLIYGTRGDDVVIVASKGGAPEHPAWYLNLRDKPEGEVQVKGDRWATRARDASDDEYAELWKLMVGHWPQYEEYQQKTDRKIPIVVLERA